MHTHHYPDCPLVHLDNHVAAAIVVFYQACNLCISESGKSAWQSIQNNNYSCMGIRYGSRLKPQNRYGSCLKPQNPCSNYKIHVLFEHGFYLKKPKLGSDLYA